MAAYRKVKCLMKILLMLPFMDLKGLWGKASQGAGNNNFSYGLASIAACLLEAGYDTQILDPQFLSGAEEFQRYLHEGGYDIIGVSSYTPTINEAIHTAHLIREALPDSVIVMGGAHCTYFPTETLEETPEVDFVIPREGEETMVELVRMLDEGTSCPKSIPGLVYRDGETIRETAPRPFVDVDTLPLPAYHLFPLEKYELQPTIYKRQPTFTMLVSRGCPYSCSFCHGFEILGRKMRYRSVDRVIEEIQLLITTYGARGIMFYDSTFTFNQEWVREFCEAVIARKLDFTWMCLTRVDCITPDLLALMRKAGCWALSLGVESGNQKTLDLLKKNVRVEQNREAINMAKKAKLYVTASYMIGLPNETEDDVRNTIRFALDNPTAIAHFFWPIPYPRTLFYEQCKESGGLKENPKWENFNIYCDDPVYVNPLIGFERMRELQAMAYRKYYTSPRVLAMNLGNITTLTDIKKYMMAAKAVIGQFRRTS